MNTAQLKIISWSAALLFGAGLAAYVGDYLVHRAVLEKRVAREEIQGKLSKVPNVEKKAEDIVSYERVNEVLYKLNWTAKAAAKPPPPTAPVEVAKPGTEPVSALLKVLLVKADASDDSGSRAVIKYQPAARVTLKDPTVVKHVGDKLDAPCDWITVAAILPSGVRFKFADSKRGEELVVPNEFEHRLDMETLAALGPGAPLRPTEITFKRGPNYDKDPEHTVRLDDDSFAIGTADMDDWDENYEQHIAEIEFDRHRDPTTGKYDGIKLSSVPAGSVAAAYGAKEGDVIKSINGHPVNSTQEAISYVKNNKDKYDVWEVEVETKGKTHVVTYKVPKKK